MKRASDYDDTMIRQFKKSLEDTLVGAIYEMVEGEDSVELGIMVSGTTYYSLTCYYEENDENEVVDTIEVRREYIDNVDGLTYSDDVELSELDLTSLYEIYNCLKIKQK